MSADARRAAEAVLFDVRRLAAVRRTRLLNAAPSEAFDRLARLAATALDVPISLVSLIDADRQILLGAHGLPEPVASTRETAQGSGSRASRRL